MLPATLPGHRGLRTSFARATSAALCAALVACAGSPEPAPSTAVRTRPPQGYEKTITSYFAFRVHGPRKNSEVIVDKPEPGECLLDGDLSARRGWVVPVVYATHTGAATARVQIRTRQYFFWFLEDTIAGITPRLEQCPGLATISFDELREADPAAATAVVAALPPPGFVAAAPDDGAAPRRGRLPDPAHATVPRRAAVAGVAKKKATTTAGKARAAPKTASHCAAGRCTHDRASSADLDRVTSRLW